MSTSKRHHTLPQRYQSGFSAEKAGGLWVFDRKQQKIWPAHPPNTAVEREFYTWESSTGPEARALESTLANLIEGPFWPVLDRLDARGMPDSTDRVRLAFFCAFLLVRVPAFRAGFHYQFSSAVASYPNLARDAALLDGLFQQTPSGLMLPAATKNQALQKMLDMGLQIGQYLLTLDTHFMYSESEEPFITTDAPFGLIRMVDEGQAKGVMAPGFLKWVPLSGRTAVGFGEPGNTITGTVVIPSKARRRNLALAAATSNLVIAGTEEQLKAVVAGLNPEPPPAGAFPVELE